MNMSFKLKRVEYLDSRTDTKRQISIVTQNENGPCPLIAVVNALILRGDLDLSASDELSFQELVSSVGQLVLERWEERAIAEGGDLKRNMDDCLALLGSSSMYAGMDMNVRFDGVLSFENTRELVLFDMLGLRVCHAWIPPSEIGIPDEVKQLTYNQVMDKLITEKSESTSAASEANTQFMLMQEFLDNSKSQITVEGISALQAALNPHEVCILFRNNHFSTLLKRVNEETSSLLVLVTDVGYFDLKNIVFEKLLDVSGDNMLLDGSYLPYNPNLESTMKQDEELAKSLDQITLKEEPLPVSNSQEDLDLAIALSLQEQERVEMEQRNQEAQLNTSNTSQPSQTEKKPFKNPFKCAQQ